MKIVKKGEVSWKWVVELENGQWGLGMSVGSQEDVQPFKGGQQYVMTHPNTWWKSKMLKKVENGQYNSKMGGKCQKQVWTFKNVIGGLRKVENGCKHMKTHQKESLRGRWSCFDSVMGGDGPVLSILLTGPIFVIVNFYVTCLTSSVMMWPQQLQWQTQQVEQLGQLRTHPTSATMLYLGTHND